MEILTILLSGLLGGLAPTGFILDSVAENQIRANLEDADVVEVRVDNTPSYQVISGKIDRLRIATRGLQLTPNIRIDTLELETDPLDVDLARLRGGGRQALGGLRQPLQGGVRLVLTEADLNQVLQSPGVQARMQKIIEGVAGNFAGAEGAKYKIVDSQLSLLGNNRLGVRVQLQLVGLTAEDLDSLVATVSQMEVSRLQQQLQQIEQEFQDVEQQEEEALRSRLEQFNLPQLQGQIAALQQLNLQDIQAFVLEVQALDLPPEAQIFPQPIPEIDLPVLQPRLAALQQTLQALPQEGNLRANLQQIEQLAAELQQPLTDLQGFLAGVRQIDVENARPFAIASQPLTISVESGLAVEGASRLRLVDPTVAIDDRPLPPFILQGAIAGLSASLDLRRLETSGVTLRLLQLEVDEDEIEVAAFVRLEPSP